MEEGLEEMIRGRHEIRTCAAAVAEGSREEGCLNKNLFILEIGKSKIKVPANLMSGEGLLPGL